MHIRGECALKKNSAVIIFLYCDINQFKHGTLLLKIPWFKTLKIFSPWKKLFYSWVRRDFYFD